MSEYGLTLVYNISKEIVRRCLPNEVPLFENVWDAIEPVLGKGGVPFPVEAGPETVPAYLAPDKIGLSELVSYSVIQCVDSGVHSYLSRRVFPSAKEFRSFVKETLSQKHSLTESELDSLASIAGELLSVELGRMSNGTDQREVVIPGERAMQGGGELEEVKRRIEAIEGVERTDPFLEIVGKSTAIQNIVSRIDCGRDSDATVLIKGETGVGKERVAEAIHQHGPRHEGPFIVGMLGGMRDDFLESELFGHEEGAYTDAKHQRIGLFEQAHEGILFLDEIGDISPACQLRLLRVLEDKTFQRLGGDKVIRVDVRVIAATNKDLAEMVSEGIFRKDLFYRLHRFVINVPPLRERKEDIPLLVDHFVALVSKPGKKQRIRFTEAAIERLLKYGWPGNVRELEECVEAAILGSKGDWVKEGDLTFPGLPLAREPSGGASAHREAMIRVLGQSETVSDAWRKLGLKRDKFYKKAKLLGIDKPREYLGRNR